MSASAHWKPGWTAENVFSEAPSGTPLYSNGAIDAVAALEEGAGACDFSQLISSSAEHATALVQQAFIVPPLPSCTPSGANVRYGSRPLWRVVVPPNV